MPSHRGLSRTCFGRFEEGDAGRQAHGMCQRADLISLRGPDFDALWRCPRFALFYKITLYEA